MGEADSVSLAALDASTDLVVVTAAATSIWTLANVDVDMLLVGSSEVVVSILDVEMTEAEMAPVRRADISS